MYCRLEEQKAPKCNASIHSAGKDPSEAASSESVVRNLKSDYAVDGSDRIRFHPRNRGDATSIHSNHHYTSLQLQGMLGSDFGRWGNIGLIRLNVCAFGCIEGAI
ncbi:hypothetical protein CEXT_223231 [Caerostris extrusa]|uniref:Uncharacterized protein n=1 Tax=Caerostris extrusa TaxID=172846 RepID=A0AAV4TKI7_CAEEX|nr:hypothetical protein CEXT_223231 [Caerostris extrusa]